MKVLITGTAGFIGFHLANHLIERGDDVVGIDSINDYYDVNLKFARLANAGIDKSEVSYNRLVVSKKYPNYSFAQMRLEDKEALESLFKRQTFDVVCNLAAQAGVRYSLNNPDVYLSSNIIGFLNILECCRHFNIGHLVYASSSSVYGLNGKSAFATTDNVDHPVSLYAASKKSNELMAHTYSHLFKIPTTGLRFFTVYGPWVRPDMALFLFTKAITEDKPIQLFNNGNMVRDFTYVTDIVEGVVRVIDNPPSANLNWDAINPDPSSSSAPYKVYNIGNSKPVKLLEYVQTIEKYLGKTAKKEMLPMQPGDVAATCADIADLEASLNYKPKITIDYGIKKFIEWYRSYYNV